MEDKQKGGIAWARAHKKQLLLAGVSVTTIIGIVVGLKNKDTIMDLWVSLEKSIQKAPEKLPVALNIAQAGPLAPKEAIPVRAHTSPKKAFHVRQHIRRLSGGKHHSAKKAAEAAALGISLLPNQTLVDTYTKCAA